MLFLFYQLYFDLFAANLPVWYFVRNAFIVKHFVSLVLKSAIQYKYILLSYYHWLKVSEGILICFVRNN